MPGGAGHGQRQAVIGTTEEMSDKQGRQGETGEGEECR
jgi:hypothetical protein